MNRTTLLVSILALVVARPTTASPPAGFTVTCVQGPNNPGCDSSWESEIRGTQEYDGDGCRSKVYFRAGRTVRTDGNHTDWVIIRFWSYADNAWNTNRQITTQDVEEVAYDERWDPTPDQASAGNLRLTSSCDETALRRIVRGLKDRWGALPPAGCMTEECWEYPDLAPWRDYALDTIWALKDADTDFRIMAANGGAICYPEREEDANPGNDGERCVVATEVD